MMNREVSTNAVSDAVDLELLFEQAIAIESSEELSEFTDRHCAGRPDLRRKLQAMLKSHREAGNFLELPLEGKSTMSRSVLAVLGDKLGDLPRVLLKQTDDDRVLHLSAPDFPQPHSQGRYQLHGELARGGMGAILRARDVDLGRDLALKVLLDDHKDNPEYLSRFIEEAQISGQLVHPGIAPVYELGQLEDERPFFSMKLVRGRTLSSLLGDRENADARPNSHHVTSELPELLKVFQQVCQTMAYAHSRGVIHRDLKPANIMVGAFGEVQVMDWGLAKVISEGGVADEKKASERIHRENSVQTLRSREPSGGKGSSLDTRLGSVMGTLAYIAPEQASGEVDRLDERADVFALGSILCEIFTGAPPYVADDSVELHRMAAKGDLAECHTRLSKAEADEALVQLTRSCLEVDRQNRPSNAAAVVRELTAYEAKLRKKVRQAELDKAVSETKIQEEYHRHRLYKSAAAALLLLLIASAVAALKFRRLSDDNEQLAKSSAKQATQAEIGFIAAKSQEILGQESEEAVLLALEAVHRSQRANGGEPSRVAREALLNSTQQLVGRPLRGHGGRIQTLIFCKGQVVALCNGLVYVWRAQEKGMIGQPVRFGSPDDPVLDIVANEERTTILLGQANRLLRWDTQLSISGSKTIATNIDGSAIAISGDGGWAVARTTDGTLRRWNLKQQDKVGSDLAAQTKRCDQIEVSFDGNRIAVRSGSTDVEILDLGGDTRLTKLLPQERRFHNIRMSRTGRWLACCEPKGIQVYDLSAESITASQRIAKHTPWSANRMRFTRDEKTLFAWLDTWLTLTKLDLTASNDDLQQETVQGDENAVICAACNNGSVLLTAGGGGKLCFHDLSKGAFGPSTSKSKLHDWPIHALSLDPTGRWLASAAWDGTTRLWDMAADDPRSSPLVLRTRHSEVTGGAAISPDSKWIARPADEYVELWDTDKPYSRPSLLLALSKEHSVKPELLHAAFGENVLLTQSTNEKARYIEQNPAHVRLWDLSKGRSDGLTGRLLPGVKVAAIAKRTGQLILVRSDLTVHMCDVQTLLVSAESSDPFDSAMYIGQHDFPASPLSRWA